MNTSSLVTILFICFTATSFSHAQITASSNVNYPLEQLSASSPVLNNVTPNNAAVVDRPQACFADSGLNFQRFFATHITYPELAAENAMEGMVILRLWVASDGEVRVLGIDRSDYAFLDIAVLAAAQELPPLLPAIVEGQAVGQSVLVPIHFSLK